MYQEFSVQGGPQFGRDRLPLLRNVLKAESLDAFYVPHEDEYQNEYLPEATDRLAWLTGFTGSAGAALIFVDQAVMFTDGRYTLQVRSQTDSDLFEYADIANHGVARWIEDNARRGARIGYDPKLVTPDSLTRLQRAASLSGAELIACETNLVDKAWTDRPAMPKAPIRPHPIALAGEAHGDKRARIGASLAKEGADAAVITAPPSIAWLFNVRGGDVSHSPLPLGAAVINADGTAEFFVDPDKLDDAARSHLGNEVSIRPEDALEDGLKNLGEKRVLIDPAASSAWHFQTLEAAGAQIVRGLDPVALPKACKNEAEIAGAKAAHVRDGAALTRFLCWFDQTAPEGGLTEIDAAMKLEAQRRETGELKDISFDSITGAAGNGAIVHYRVSEASNKAIEPGALFLIDSGGQYEDGTTDVTRTLPVGEPGEEMRERYTLVLKGHIAMTVIRFPSGTSGAALDALARAPLWMRGLDYDHGTGHGVGAYLGVHEGPQRIAKGGSDIALKPGMIVSNEPGYYKADAYGIRIENLQYVTEPEEVAGGDRPMMGFETLTLAPLARTLIDISLLTEDERAWVDAYHARVYAELAPLLDEETASWLRSACAPL